MRRTPIDKVRGLVKAISESGVLHDFQIELLFLYVRQHIEELGKDAGSSLENLNFLCNWVIHTKMNFDQNLDPLRYVANRFGKDGSDIEVTGFVQEVVRFGAAFAELERLLHESGIEPFLVTESSRCLSLSILDIIDGREISCRDKMYDQEGYVDRLKIGSLRVGNDLVDVISFAIVSRMTESGLQVFQCVAKTIARLHDHKDDGRGRISVVWDLLPGRCLCGSDDLRHTGQNFVTCEKCGIPHDFGITSKK